MTSPVTHEDAVLASLRQLKDAVAQNTADLAIQFQRIAQMQAELDVLRSALPEKGSARKKSPPDRLRSVAADRLHDAVFSTSLNHAGPMVRHPARRRRARQGDRASPKIIEALRRICSRPAVEPEVNFSDTFVSG
ncbi:MAG: hypothetical protein Q7J25_06605 [Vicinamibacterales bacterium]|nr:hypothetical protein [Vicinamibacterales bacterium]